MSHVVINGEKFVLDTLENVWNAWRKMQDAGLVQVYVRDDNGNRIPDSEFGGFHTLSLPNPIPDLSSLLACRSVRPPNN
jgi:hypothetical protein